MLMADTIAIALSILGILLSFQGLWLLCRAICPNRVRASADACRERPVMSLVVGGGIYLAIWGVVHVADRTGPVGKLANVLLLTALLIYTSIGMSGLATHIGQRLESPVDDLRPWRATLRGGVALALAWLVPILGWFVILLGSFFVGAGAMTLGYFAPRRGRGRGVLPPPPIDFALGGRLSDPNAPTYRPTQSHEEAMR